MAENDINLSDEKYLRRCIKVGDAIIMAGYAGTYGAVNLLETEKDRIIDRFGSLIYRQLLDKCRQVSYIFHDENTDFPNQLKTEEFAGAESSYGKNTGTVSSDFAGALKGEDIFYCREVSEGGSYGSLRQLGKWLDKSTGRGIAVENKAIPILQETIEICECLDRNPYKEDGNGSLILVCRNEDRVINSISEKFPEIPVKVIGRITGSRESMVFFGEGEHKTL